MISRKIQKVAVIAGLVSLLVGSITFLMTWKNVGFADNFMSSWLSSFALCILVIAPMGGVISFLINKAVNALLANFTVLKKDIAFGLMMAVAMESLMAVVTTVNLYGFLDLNEFFNYWGASFLTALPLGIVISICLTLLIKPRLIEFWARA